MFFFIMEKSLLSVAEMQLRLLRLHNFHWSTPLDNGW